MFSELNIDAIHIHPRECVLTDITPTHPPEAVKMIIYSKNAFWFIFYAKKKGKIQVFEQFVDSDMLILELPLTNSTGVKYFCDIQLGCNYYFKFIFKTHHS